MKKVIFDATEKLLTMRSHSEQELKQKLLKKFPNEKAEVEACIEYFIHAGVVNDELFAKEYAKYILRHHPKGLFMLKYELQKKGIGEPLLSKTLSLLKVDEGSMAQKLALQKINSLPALLDNRKKMEKVYRFLLSRGFPFDISRKAAEEAIKE